MKLEIIENAAAKIASMRIALDLRRITTGHTLRSFFYVLGHYVIHETALEIAQKARVKRKLSEK